MPICRPAGRLKRTCSTAPSRHTMGRGREGSFSQGYGMSLDVQIVERSEDAYAPSVDRTGPTRHLPDEPLELIRKTGRLNLDLANPGWDDYRGYLFDEDSATLYFPVAKKYLTGDLSKFRVLIASRPPVVVEGELSTAGEADDVVIQLRLAHESGMEAEKARFMVLKRRTQTARRTRYKLAVRQVFVARG